VEFDLNHEQHNHWSLEKPPLDSLEIKTERAFPFPFKRSVVSQLFEKTFSVSLMFSSQTRCILVSFFPTKKDDYARREGASTFFPLRISGAVHGTRRLEIHGKMVRLRFTSFR
jgi:hypothetical protein